MLEPTEHICRKCSTAIDGMNEAREEENSWEEDGKVARLRMNHAIDKTIGSYGGIRATGKVASEFVKILRRLFCCSQSRRMKENSIGRNMRGISGRIINLSSDHSRNSPEVKAEIESKRQEGAGGRRRQIFMATPFKNLLLITVLLHMATVTMEANDFLHSNATDKGQLISTEVCQMEAFQASCPEQNEVLVIVEALLGRMHLGRCISEAFGYLNCSLDVLSEMDVFCSGRRTCEVKVDDSSFKRKVPRCHKDLKNHLKVTYSCIKVLFPSGGTKCQTVELSHGFISSHVTASTGCGLTGSPWIIQADPGQRINVTLFDFSHEHEDLSGAGPSSASCRVYATVRDSPSIARDLQVCEQRRSRISHAYLSTGNRIEIRIMSGKIIPANVGTSSIQQARSSPQFLLQFQVVGCADLLGGASSKEEEEEGVDIDRHGDRVTVSCHGSGRSWQLICSENKWIGSYGNCDVEDVKLVSGLHYATSTIILVIIAFVVSSLILVVGVVCIRRKKSEIDRIQAHQLTVDQYDLGNYRTGTVSPDKLTPSSEYVIGAPAPPSFDATGNEYARMRIMYLPQYDLKEEEEEGVGGGSRPPPYDTGGGGGRYVDHIYESPDCLGGRSSPECRRVYAVRIGGGQPPPQPPPPQLLLPSSSADRSGGGGPNAAARAEAGVVQGVVQGGRHRMDASAAAAVEGGCCGANAPSSCVVQKHGSTNNRTTGNYSL